MILTAHFPSRAIRRVLRALEAATLSKRLACVSASVGLVLSLGLPAQARRVWPVVGVHAGDVTVAAQCHHGDILRGLAGRAGLWVDEIQLLCNAPNASNGAPAAESDRYGGVGGAPFTVSCASSDRLYATKIDLTADGKRVKNIILYCVAADGNTLNRQEINGDQKDSMAQKKCGKVLSVGDFLAGMGMNCATQSDYERRMAQQSCPDEEFVGATVRFGDDVNSIGFICDSVAAN